MLVLNASISKKSPRDLLLHLKETLDDNFDTLLEVIDNNRDARFSIEDVLYEVAEHLVLPEQQVREEKVISLYNEDYTIPKDVFEILLGGDDNQVGVKFFELDFTEASRILVILEHAGCLNGTGIKLVRDEITSLPRYELVQIELGSAAACAELYESLQEKASKLKEKLSLSNQGFGSSNTPSSCNKEQDDSDQTANSDLIDFSLGECQYVSAAQSETLIPGPWDLGMDHNQRLVCELVYRGYTPRQLISLLRQTGYRSSNETLLNGDLLYLREFKGLGITALCLKNRVITFGWTRKLPRDLRTHVTCRLSPYKCRKMKNHTAQAVDSNRFSVLKSVNLDDDKSSKYPGSG